MDIDPQPTSRRKRSDWMSALSLATIPTMFNRKRLIAVLAGLSLLVAACGGDNAESTTTEVEQTTTTASEPTTTEPPATTTTEAVDESTTTAAEEPAIVLGEDPDVDAVVAVYQVVFDSSTSYEEKAAFIDDASGLEETVATYQATGDSVGGVTAEPTSVTVNEEEADVVYTLFFSGNPTYPGQEGTAVLTDEGWKVTRDMFCGVMASARSACPTG